MNKVIVICGPTAVGKTKLSVELAKKLDGEIVNADSTQVYRGMDIGTAKVTEEEKENIPHHLFDIKFIEEDYTVYDYQKDCRFWIEDILKRSKTPILVGGTGLYIKAALYDYHFEEEKEKKDYHEFSNEELYQKLLAINPNTNIHPNNRKRVERAIAYYEQHGKNLEEEKTDTLLYDTIFIGLTTDRPILYERINNRVHKMLEDGLIEEAKRLYPYKEKSRALMTPICYKELFEYFDQRITEQEAIELIQKRSRNYAKRQYTWFYHQLPIEWFSVDFDNFQNTIDDVIQRVTNRKIS